MTIITNEQDYATLSDRLLDKIHYVGHYKAQIGNDVEAVVYLLQSA